uniref:Cystatin domain-containing protein n=1 Tax=Parastrongyloides trichosuri TaxID=131310 RepID=A0A0N4ZQA7_PARTI
MVTIDSTDNIMGGWSNMTDSDEINLLAQKITEKYISQYNKNVTLSKVLEAKQQVVAGMNYKLTLLTVDSPCDTNNQCSKKITANVFSQPWTNTEDITILNVSNTIN